MKASPVNQSKASRVLSRSISIMKSRGVTAICAIVILLGFVACGHQIVTTPPSTNPTAVSIEPTVVPATVAPTVVPILSPTPVTPPPTPPCVQATLTLGTRKFSIETLRRAADGSIQLPPDKPDAAFWIEGTNAHYVFALGPSANNLALKDSLKSGDVANILWGDCSTDEYVVTGMETATLDLSKLLDQSVGGMTVVVLPNAFTQALVITGSRPKVQGATPNATEASGVQAELSFLGNKVSPDGKTLTMSIALKNTGDKSFTLSASDISLTAQNAALLAPLSVEPALPQEIKPGASANFQITFPRPAGNTAVFKLLDFSNDIYF